MNINKKSKNFLAKRGILSQVHLRAPAVSYGTDGTYLPCSSLNDLMDLIHCDLHLESAGNTLI